MQNLKIKNKNLAAILLTSAILYAPIAHSGISEDKKLHYQVSAIIGSGLYFMHNAYDTNKDEKSEEIISVGFSLTACSAIGLSKEFYDEHLASGFDKNDMVANIAGCLTGAYASRYINKNIRITPTFDTETTRFNGVQIAKIF